MMRGGICFLFFQCLICLLTKSLMDCRRPTLSRPLDHNPGKAFRSKVIAIEKTVSFIGICATHLALNSLTFSINDGSICFQSPTAPKWATLNILASGSRLMATMVLALKHPAKCWLAPEMAIAK
jgi:hypothetical protein